MTGQALDVKLAAIAPLFGELQDLKRLRPANLDATIATRLFRDSWSRLLAGEETGIVATDLALAALLSVLFPGVDGAFFTAANMDKPTAREVLGLALEATVAGHLTSGTHAVLKDAFPAYLDRLYDHSAPAAPLPEPLDILCRQPRAGATHPTLPRLVLEPAEMHSDHCCLTAVYAILLADGFGADRGTVLLASLAHHLHNAYLPDCGYAGELCLGEHLGPVIANCRQTALAHFPTDLRARVREALRHHESIAAPEGRAVSAGDVLDRVLDVRWRTRAAAVTDTDILSDLDLVHPGPLKDFQGWLLDKTGVWKA